eukprot:SAG22_NODE_1668_length_3850_cov_3.516662_4_plen_263_part_00
MTSDTDSLRRLARLLAAAPKPTADARTVVEIGCSYGACSAMICEPQQPPPPQRQQEQVQEQQIVVIKSERLAAEAAQASAAAAVHSTERNSAGAAASRLGGDGDGSEGDRARTKALPFCCASTVVLSKTVPFCAVLPTHVSAGRGPGGVIACPGGWWDAKVRQIGDAERGLLAARTGLGAGSGQLLRSANWYPQREVPTRPGLLICRHHNYSPKGCTTTSCAYDHTVCHFCFEEGHAALSGCEKFQRTVTDRQADASCATYM